MIYSQLTVYKRKLSEERFSDISLTVPNQMPPLKAVLSSLAAGNSLRIGKNVYYDSPTEEHPDPLARPVDITDVVSELSVVGGRISTEINQRRNDAARAAAANLKDKDSAVNDTGSVAAPASPAGISSETLENGTDIRKTQNRTTQNATNEK